MLPWSDETPDFPCTWRMTIKMSNETCNVIMIQAEKAEDIPDVLRANLEDINQNRPEERENQKFLEQTISMIGVPGFDHTDSMLPSSRESIEQALKERFGRKLEPGSFIYLSWVTNVQR